MKKKNLLFQMSFISFPVLNFPGVLTQPRKQTGLAGYKKKKKFYLQLIKKSLVVVKQNRNKIKRTLRTK